MQKYILCFLLMSFSADAAFAQAQNDPPFKTPNTHLRPAPNPKNARPERKKIRYIIKKDTKAFLAGNKCFEEVTKEMGFMYLAVPKGQSYYTSEFRRNLHNLGVKTIILLKNGPFWKIKINKTYKKCKYGYADYAAP